MSIKCEKYQVSLLKMTKIKRYLVYSNVEYTDNTLDCRMNYIKSINCVVSNHPPHLHDIKKLSGIWCLSVFYFNQMR